VYGQLANGLPAVTYGPWSPIYTTKNSVFQTGALTLAGTLSDTLSTPSNPDAHQLMPAFLFRGNTGLFGQSTELYRVYVFTDRDCINTVFKGAIVGGPAYAPRPFGPLALPTSQTGIDFARKNFLPDGKEPLSMTYDLDRVDTTEQASPAAPYTPKKTADPTTGSPTKRTRSAARNGRVIAGGRFGRVAGVGFNPVRSPAVNTRSTPGADVASATSTDSIVACAYGERTYAHHASFGKWMLST